MKAMVRIKSGDVWLEVEAENPKDAVKTLSAFQEVFCGHKCDCGCTDMKWEHREHDGHDYYSVVCLSCRKQRQFGQHKNGRTLFAKGDWHTRPSGNGNQDAY